MYKKMNNTFDWIEMFFSLVLILAVSSIEAQVAINSNGVSPHTSAMLDISSSDKGLLIPSMDSTARKAIGDPAHGLMVFDSTYNSFYYHNGVTWQAVGADNLGNHNATQNLQLNTNWINSDGEESEGIIIDTTGRTGVNINPDANFHVSMGFRPNPEDLVNFHVFDPSFSATSTNSGYQTFVSVYEGKLEQLQISFDSSISYGTKTLSLYEGEGTTGTLLFTSVPSNFSNGEFDFVPPSPDIILKKGHVYTMEINNIDGWMYKDNNSYLDGYSSLDPNFDMDFQVRGFRFRNGFQVTDSSVVFNKYSFPIFPGFGGQILQYDGGGKLTWKDGNTLSDADNDTKIRVEQYYTGDGDSILFDLMGSERLVLKQNLFGSTIISLPNNSGNTFLGIDAGLNNANTENTLIGHQAGKNIGDEGSNTFVGYNSGLNTNSSNNTFLGTNAGASNINGDQNTYLGAYAGNSAIGRANVFIGSFAGNFEMGDDKLYIENSGSTSPLIYGDFSSDSLVVNGALQSTGMLYANSGIHCPNAFGPDPMYVGNIGNSISFGHIGVSEDALGYSNNTFYFHDSPGGGDAVHPAVYAGIFPTYSSQRWKHNIKDIIDPISVIQNLRGVTYKWNEDHGGKNDFGFIAEEVNAILPQIAPKNEDGQVDGVAYGRITPLLVEAIKEQQKTIVQQQKLIEQLLDANIHFQSELDDVKSAITQITHKKENSTSIRSVNIVKDRKK